LIYLFYLFHTISKKDRILDTLENDKVFCAELDSKSQKDLESRMEKLKIKIQTLPPNENPEELIQEWNLIVQKRDQLLKSQHEKKKPYTLKDGSHLSNPNGPKIDSNYKVFSFLSFFLFLFFLPFF